MDTINSRRISAPSKNFANNEHGGTMMQFALLAGALAIITALAVPAAIEANSQFAGFGDPELDRMTTGSIENKKRYRVVKSILNNETLKLPNK